MNMTARKILVAVDGSASSMRALEFVGRKYRHSAHVSLLVLYVQQPLPPSRFVTRAMIADHHARMSEEALKPARVVIARLKLNADCYARTGDPASTIVSFARRTRCSEIVMGTRGLSKIPGLFLGSVATKVIHLAPVPVTVVK